MLARPATPLLLALCLTIVGPAVAGCGADDGGGDPRSAVPDGYPTVAPLRFDGAFEVISVVIGDEPVPLEPPPVIAIDVVTGGIEADIGCNRYLGSYTLTDAGDASFTFSGGTSERCRSLESVEQPAVAAFERLDRWAGADPSVVFTSPAGDRIELRRISGT